MIVIVKKIVAASVLAATLAGTVAATATPAAAFPVPHVCNVYKRIVWTPFGHRVIYDRRCFWF
jgi:hypothetical protein